jgi:hypothetical protein
MQQAEGPQESLSAELDRQISQIESEVRRELKIEELKENVQKSIECAVPRPVIPDVPAQPIIAHTDNRVETLAPTAGKTSHKWTGAEKWGTGIAAVTPVSRQNSIPAENGAFLPAPQREESALDQELR